MTDELLPISDDWVKNWRASIAIKITAAVLYGVVFVGLVFTIFALRNVEEKIRSEWSAQADQFAYQVTADLEGAPLLSASAIESAVRRHSASFHFSGVSLTVDQQRLLVGNPPGKSFSLVRTVQVNGPSLQTPRQAVTLELFFPPIQESAKNRRNGFFFMTAVMALVFGFFLTWVIRRFITKPFKMLINATKAVSGGDLALRLDARGEDEFGYLSRFFNRMLDQINAELKERQQAEAQIKKLAYYDSLTNLPNRLLFQDRLQLAISHAHRHQQLLALLFLDLDNFKRINDTLGHQAGDLLLKEVALRLTDSIRSTDTVTHQGLEDSGVTVARQGGDEFTILITGIRHAPYAATVAQRFLDTLTTPFLIAGHEVFITASLGISLYPVDGEDLDSLLMNADIAMYAAKSRGKNNYQYFQQFMNIAAIERLSMEASLRKAMEQDEFVLYYQPQVDIRTGTIIGMEALLRWQHPDRGIVLPEEFVPLAEEVGLIVPLGEWVLRTACAQNREWQKHGHASLCVSVNISRQQLIQQNFIEKVAGALDACGMEPRCLILEITENTIMKHSNEIMDIFYALTGRGIRFSMDDFGTGYSSLSYLKSFLLHEIKIDRAFIKDITVGVDDTAIARAIIAMARSLNLRVVAEGVETELQLNVLYSEGCYVMQGNLISPPIPGDEMLKFLARSRDEGMRIGPGESDLIGPALES